MKVLAWKLAGGLLPFLLALYTASAHPHYTIPILGLAIIAANAVGFIEGHYRKVGL